MNMQAEAGWGRDTAAMGAGRSARIAARSRAMGKEPGSVGERRVNKRVAWQVIALCLSSISFAFESYTGIRRRQLRIGGRENEDLGAVAP
jgi:hypothetical protein